MNQNTSSSGALHFVVVAAAFMIMPPAFSQVRGCEISETPCVEERIVQHCRIMTATVSGCLSWIEDLELSSPSESIDATIAQANSYFSLAELIARQRNPENNDEIERYHGISRFLFQTAYDQNNSNLDALHGLAATSNTIEENSHWLREISIADPADPIARRILAGRMAASGGSGALEAAKLTIPAYDAMEVSSQKWSLARTALRYLENSGFEEEYDSFRQRVLSDLELDSIESDIRENIRSQNVVGLQSRLAVACDPSVIAMLNASPCDSLVLLILTLSESLPSQTRVEVLNVTAEMAKNVFGNVNLDAISEWHERLGSELQMNFIAVGIESAGIYSLYEVITRGDPAPSLLAAQRAVELAPENGQYRMILGQKYLSQGNSEEALAQFIEAKALLPDYMQLVLDSLVERAEALRISTGAVASPD